MQSIASKSYKAGDLVFECQPIIHCIESAFKGKHCDNCLEKSISLKKCSKCFQMYYCDKECQQSDWKWHKNECKVYRHPNFQMGSVAQRLLIRLWLCIKSDPHFLTKRYKTMDGTDICLNEVKIETKNIFKDQILYGFFSQISLNFENYGIFFDRKQLLNWFALVAPGGLTFDLKYYTDSPAKMDYSSFEQYSSVIGSGLFIQIPPSVHSCVPNANIITNGLKLQFRAIKPIGSGEDITLTLVDLGQNKSQRHKMLAMYSIKCNCDKCRLNLDEDIDYDEYNNLLEDNRHNWRFIGDSPKARKENKDFLIDENLNMYLRTIFGDYHAQVSEALVLSFICFSMYSNKSSKSLVKLWYKKIEPSVLITHGSDHPLYNLFNNVYVYKLIESNLSKNKK